MRYSPSDSEVAAFESMPDNERLEYFLSRVAEAEEVWGLGNASGWVMRESDGVTSLPVWPYRQFAMACAVDDWEAQAGNAVSLEHFIFNVLQMMKDADIQVEIMPAVARRGVLLDPQYLFKLFESLIESGEYFLEG